MRVSLPEPLDVIAVGAHPDDLEIGCGGTLALLSRQGYRVGMVDLTDGEPTPNCPDPAIRMEEAAKAANILGVTVRETLTLPNRKLFDCWEARVALAKVFRKYRPRLVIGIEGRTPMASPDHWQARQIIDAAVFYSRLTKWDDQFDSLVPHTISQQIWYPLALRTLPQCTTDGQLVVDITETFDQKIASIRAYQTQFPPEKARLFKLVEGRNIHLGMLVSFDYGELFFTGMIGVQDLVQTVCPNN